MLALSPYGYGFVDFSTHPPPSQRMASILARVRDRTRAKGGLIDPRIDDLIDDIISIDQRARELFPPLENPHKVRVRCDY